MNACQDLGWLIQTLQSFEVVKLSQMETCQYNFEGCLPLFVNTYSVCYYKSTQRYAFIHVWMILFIFHHESCLRTISKNLKEFLSIQYHRTLLCKHCLHYVVGQILSRRWKHSHEALFSLLSPSQLIFVSSISD